MARAGITRGAGQATVNPMKLSLESLQPEDASGPCGPGLTSTVGHVLNYPTEHRFELINLTERVEELVSKSGIREGMVFVQSLHSTAALFVNEWQDALLDDLRTLLEEAVRDNAPWRHNDPRYSDCDRGNSPHICGRSCWAPTLCWPCAPAG
jgi:thiamine phosphate synthase YjbQ (UPF0047 family)